MEVTLQGPVEANRGVRIRICAAGKALEGDDRQTHKQIYGNYREIIMQLLTCHMSVIKTNRRHGRQPRDYD